MPLTILAEDGPLGPAGTQVWVNEPDADHGKHEAPEKPARKAPAKKQADKS